MDWKQRLQEDLQGAMRAQDEPRVNAIRGLVAALEKAQEEKGKEAFDPSKPQETDIPPDREQALSPQTIQEVIRAEVQLRKERGDVEENEIAILEQYLTAL